MKSSLKKKEQLGMDPGTAQYRLTRDVLFSLVMKLGYTCHHCGQPLTRETFSLEHKKPWLDSINPVENFFSIENIAFSHLSCNSGAARRAFADHGSRRSYEKGCRCFSCRRIQTEYGRSRYIKRRSRICGEYEI